MNKTKIEWADYTWNPVTGCLHGCKYCYARKIANRFGGASETHYNECVGEECQWCTEETGKIHDLKEPIYDVDRGHNAPYPFGFDPTFHRHRLVEPQRVKKSQRIFVVSMGDLFGEWIPDEWILEVFKACEAAPWHKYLFLTKNPEKYTEKDAIFHAGNSKRNWWYGTTVTTQYDYDKKAGKLPLYRNGFLSIEPILESIELKKIHQLPIKMVIVGQQTNPDKLPKGEWVQDIIDQCRAARVPVFVKSPLYEKFPIQEWPEGLK
jgi:protein gp37